MWEELVASDVYSRLQAVGGLRRGRSDARETEPVRPVPEDHIEAVRSLVSRQVRAIIDLQLHTAARPGEILGMRAIDIDTGGQVWRYTPQTHKTQHHGHSRVIHIGPKGQRVLMQFMGDRSCDAPLFSPREAVAESRAERRRNRKTPESCGNVPGTNRAINPKRQPSDRYDVNAYRQAVQRACTVAGIPLWTPHRLRHNAATRLRAEAGIDVAQTLLGHRIGSVITELYAEANVSKAVEVVLRIG